jgi:hypothetical protein
MQIRYTSFLRPLGADVGDTALGLGLSLLVILGLSLIFKRRSPLPGQL